MLLCNMSKLFSIDVMVELLYTLYETEGLLINMCIIVVVSVPDTNVNGHSDHFFMTCDRRQPIPYGLLLHASLMGFDGS